MRTLYGGQQHWHNAETATLALMFIDHADVIRRSATLALSDANECFRRLLGLLFVLSIYAHRSIRVEIKRFEKEPRNLF